LRQVPGVEDLYMVLGSLQPNLQGMPNSKNMARERMLPNDKPLEKVGRYEAHLSRLFQEVLYELEAMQTRLRAALLHWLASTQRDRWGA